MSNSFLIPGNTAQEFLFRLFGMLTTFFSDSNSKFSRFTVWHAVSGSVATFLLSIFGIFAFRSTPKMRWINTSWIITMVKYAGLITRYRSHITSIRKSMSPVFFNIGIIDVTIPVSIATFSPIPTSSDWINFNVISEII